VIDAAIGASLQSGLATCAAQLAELSPNHNGRSVRGHLGRPARGLFTSRSASCMMRQPRQGAALEFTTSSPAALRSPVGRSLGGLDARCSREGVEVELVEPGEDELERVIVVLRIEASWPRLTVSP
jgi:hypothetical protein